MHDPLETLQQQRKTHGGAPAAPIPAADLLDLVVHTLEEHKARDVTVLDVRGKTGITDYMVVASGSSDRHVKALADHVLEKAKERGLLPIGTEGQEASEWVLVDLGDVIVHTMKQQTRELYQLEKLWGKDFDDASVH